MPPPCLWPCLECTAVWAMRACVCIAPGSHACVTGPASPPPTHNLLTPACSGNTTPIIIGCPGPDAHHRPRSALASRARHDRHKHTSKQPQASVVGSRDPAALLPTIPPLPSSFCLPAGPLPTRLGPLPPRPTLSGPLRGASGLDVAAGGPSPGTYPGPASEQGKACRLRLSGARVGCRSGRRRRRQGRSPTPLPLGVIIHGAAHLSTGRRGAVCRPVGSAAGGESP